MKTTPTSIPDLEPHCGSWICISPLGTVREFFSRANTEKAAAYGWRVETAAQYLGRINAALKVNRGLPKP